MNEINILCSKESPQIKNKEIIITADDSQKNLLYKFLIGKDGLWRTLKDFSRQNTALWKSENDGRYIIMVQAKKENSTKGFDYISRKDFIIGEAKNSIIKHIYIDSNDIKIGDKVTVNVEPNKIPILYRYWIMRDNKWELLKSYSPENQLHLTIIRSGSHQILVECKDLNSSNNYDDFKTISFNVKELKKIEIKSFKCLTKNIIIGKEILFEVDADYDDNRMILYKFVKIDSDGNSICIQDFSTKRLASFVENTSGKYKLLCIAKDMYSTNVYDDRAIIMYYVKKYEKIEIQTFTTDLSSPQIIGSSIELKVIATGGNDLLFRFIIYYEGNKCQDSGYITYNKYIWKPKYSGSYKIIATVKDKSCKDEFETKKEIKFNIDEISKEEVKIKDVIFNKKDGYLIGEVINAEVIAKGGTDLKYSFVVREHDEKSEEKKVLYGNCNLINFIPKKCGIYDLEIMVKDKYSKRKYDCHEIIPLEIKNYIPANIDYVLKYPYENYTIGDIIKLEVVIRDTKNVLVKYELQIDNRPVEETDFIENKRYKIIPKCKGNYIVKIYAKNKRSTEKYDCEKKMLFYVSECLPVRNTKISSDRHEFKCNEVVNFSVKSSGGKDLLYEFYIMEKGEWSLIQKYSRKDYYSFIPFCPDTYKILVLSKGMYTKSNYEDYDILEFKVN